MTDDRSWARTGAAGAVREVVLLSVLGPLIDLYTRVREHLDDVRPPVLFVANHSSHMDTPVILRALPRAWRRRTAVAAAADYSYRVPWLAHGFRAARQLGVELVAVNPSSVQGPGRSSGNGRIIIAYLNGRLPVFVDTYVSVVDIADTVEGHLLAAARGRSGERYLLNGATIPSPDALRIVSELTGITDRVRMVPPVLARAAAALAEGAARASGRTTSLCRARVRTILHGHRYDGSRAERELGLRYTPVAETFRRTIDWAVAEGLVTRRLPRA